MFRDFRVAEGGMQRYLTLHAMKKSWLPNQFEWTIHQKLLLEEFKLLDLKERTNVVVLSLRRTGLTSILAFAVASRAFERPGSRCSILCGRGSDGDDAFRLAIERLVKGSRFCIPSTSDVNFYTFSNGSSLRIIPCHLTYKEEIEKIKFDDGHMVVVDGIPLDYIEWNMKELKSISGIMDKIGFIGIKGLNGIREITGIWESEILPPRVKFSNITEVRRGLITIQ